MGRILAKPAQACVDPGAGLDFSYSSAAERSRQGLVEEDQQSMGVFVSSDIPGARIVVDASTRSVTVEFLSGVSVPIVVLVPEQVGQPVQVSEAVRTDQVSRAVFRDLPDGGYLLSVYVPEEE
jgi:hypothetical protein